MLKFTKKIPYECPTRAFIGEIYKKKVSEWFFSLDVIKLFTLQKSLQKFWPFGLSFLKTTGPKSPKKYEYPIFPWLWLLWLPSKNENKKRIMKQKCYPESRKKKLKTKKIIIRSWISEKKIQTIFLIAWVVAHNVPLKLHLLNAW